MSKYSAEIKISPCKEYLTGALSHEDICKKYEIPLHFKKIIQSSRMDSFYY
ncbi:MAG TPA: hypothetical protein GXZ28_05980 [Clostridiales bacterium]|jgi:transposase-like protein|nr:hypothetical protein [Clostridiales bacterium]